MIIFPIAITKYYFVGSPAKVYNELIGNYWIFISLSFIFILQAEKQSFFRSWVNYLLPGNNIITYLCKKYSLKMYNRYLIHRFLTSHKSPFPRHTDFLSCTVSVPFIVFHLLYGSYFTVSEKLPFTELLFRRLYSFIPLGFLY